ncbi:7554_t:CDS:2 [Funneliformis geosporum]|uniref:19071_t:CDS:1 n=1 Tax=Funneliformis geosporum TaxID=1117311 RepID=A0A9W4SIN1_9GLOM|nr:7554_t:CDS:2 [Funneliformis geosporum]CAI2169740.1 19071_t:CDS:2 [Funneliformis geosporum]
MSHELEYEEASAIMHLHTPYNRELQQNDENEVRDDQHEEKDYKVTLEDGEDSEKIWSEDDIHKNETWLNVAENYDGDSTKHRNDRLNKEERPNFKSINNEDETCLKGTSFHPTSPPRYLSPSESYSTKEQTIPISFSNTFSQATIPLAIPNISFGSSSCQHDIDIARIVNPIVKCISDMKSEFQTQFFKHHYEVDPNPSAHMTNVGEEWQNTEFMDQYAAFTAGRLLDVILTMKLPEEAKKCLVQARHIIWEKVLHHHNTVHIYFENVSMISGDNVISRENGSVVKEKNKNQPITVISTNVEEQASTTVTTNDESSNDQEDYILSTNNKCRKDLFD